MSKKALFLDRDGIVNVDHGYTHKIEAFEFFPEIFDITAYYQSMGYLIVIVTNQSGIGRGYYTQDQFLALTAWMEAQFERSGIWVATTYFCPHTPDDNCHCRKPRTGMVERAVEELKIDLENSMMVGDKSSDIELAERAGIGTSIYIGDKHNTAATYSFKTIAEFKQKMLEW